MLPFQGVLLGLQPLQLLAAFVEFDLQIGGGRAGGDDVGAEGKHRVLRQFLREGAVVGVPCVVAFDFKLERLACLRDVCGLRRAVGPFGDGKVLDGGLGYERNS